MKKPSKKTLRGFAKLAAAEDREYSQYSLHQTALQLLHSLFVVAHKLPELAGRLVGDIGQFAYAQSLMNSLQDTHRLRFRAKMKLGDKLYEANEEIKRAKARRKSGRLF